MPTTRARDGDTTLTGNEQFLDLLCADEALLRAEFDAIIAAEWPSPPPAEADRGAGAEPRPRRTRRRIEASQRRSPAEPATPPRCRPVGPATLSPSRGSHNRRQQGR